MNYYKTVARQLSAPYALHIMRLDCASSRRVFRSRTFEMYIYIYIYFLTGVPFVCRRELHMYDSDLVSYIPRPQHFKYWHMHGQWIPGPLSPHGWGLGMKLVAMICW